MRQENIFSSDLNEPLLNFSNQKGDSWTIGDAVKGVFIVGGIGSGKSSGSGQTIAKSYLRAGFGGVVLCAKPDEADTWRRYCKETGRENSLIVFDGSGAHRFNFLDYEMNRADFTGDKTQLAVEVLMKIYEAMNAYDDKGEAASDNPYWENAVKMLLINVIDILFLVYGQLRIISLLNFIRAIPQGAAEWEQARKDIASGKKSETSFYKTLALLDGKLNQLNSDQKQQANNNLEFLEGYLELEPKTKSVIWSSLEAMLLDFSRGDIEKIFCTETSLTPEYAAEGAIIVLDFPLKVWQRGGYLAQHIFKYAYQRFIERRKIGANSRPCFLWADEAQLFVSSYDKEFLSTVRSAKCCTVYLTQSIPAIKTKMKGGQDAADELLNNFQTRIIHTCFDKTTQEWAADSIGEAEKGRWSENFSRNENIGTAKGINKNYGTNDGLNAHAHNAGLVEGGIGGGRNYGNNYGEAKNENQNIGQGVNEGLSKNIVIERELLPSFFGAGLRMGGKENSFIVDGVAIRAGKAWEHSNKRFLVCSFEQTEGKKWKFL